MVGPVPSRITNPLKLCQIPSMLNSFLVEVDAISVILGDPNRKRYLLTILTTHMLRAVVDAMTPEPYSSV